MVQLSNTLVQLCGTWFTFPELHSFGKSCFKDPNIDARTFGLITKLEKYQSKVFPVLCFSLQYLEMSQKNIQTLDSSDNLKVVHYPYFTLSTKMDIIL